MFRTALDGLKAPLAGSPGEWAANMNRLDLPGVDDPKESLQEKAEEPGLGLRMGPSGRILVWGPASPASTPSVSAP